MLVCKICMPMWCTSSDAPTTNQGVPQPHHRIVRIPPGESVVLNSAERAPYLLLIEILHSELDFDPVKRSNKEILKKIVVKESESKGTSKDLVSFGRSDTSKSKPAVIIPDHVNGSDAALGTDAGDTEPAELPATSPLITSPSEDADEEVDLVEQLYGNENALKATNLDLSDSIVLPPAPKNKELDMAAWSRAPSNPDTPSLDKLDPFAAYNPSLSLSIPPSRASQFTSSSDPNTPARTPVHPTRVLSLDEYSERMRTAAVMLAQLNLAREPVGPSPGAPAAPGESSMLGAPLRWLPGTSWLAANGNSHLAGAGTPADPAPSRMKLQASEASAIRDRIMEEMLALEEERMARMRESGVNEGSLRIAPASRDMKTAEDESIIRKELSKADPSAVVFSESWAAKKVGCTMTVSCVRR